MAYKISLFDTDYDCIGTGCMSLDYISYQLQCAAGQDVEIDISSGGGSAFDAVAIYHILKAYSGNVTTNNISLAGSAASTILAAGKKRTMSKYALLMIHPAQVESFGDAIELQADAEMIQKVTDNVISIWVDVSGQSIEKITELVNATTWLNADEALALGFITDIEDYENVSLEDLGITNGSLILNQIKTAPSKYKQVINQILIKQPAPAPQTNNDMASVTKEEVEAMVKPTNSLLKRIWNFISPQVNKVATDKGDLFIVGNLVEGSAVYNDGEMDIAAEDATDVLITNAAGKQVTLSIAGGKITNVKKEDDDTDADPDKDDDDDMEADNKIVAKNHGVNIAKVENKIDHKAIKNALATKLKEVSNKVDVQNALIAEMRTQLQASNALVQRSEIEVKNQILTEFVPNNSNRQSRPGAVGTALPSFMPKDGTLAGNAAKKAVNKI